MRVLKAAKAACRRLLRRRSNSTMSVVFSGIYHNNTWGSDESVSGPGSTVARTAPLRPRLVRLLQELRIQTLLDAPCGDFNWLKETVLPISKYLGVDVVPKIIERNRQAFGNDQRKFHCLDITNEELPKADLILCRDCLVHLSFKDALSALDNFRRSGAAYLLTTTFPACEHNLDIETGEW